MRARSLFILYSIFVHRLFTDQVSQIAFKMMPFLAASRPIHQAVTIALICHSIHYAKRLYETQFVHRFSNGTMPIRNLFKVSL
jgi:very-long-chain enoyl-CoA reductase